MPIAPCRQRPRGSTDGCDYVANFIRRRKTMFRKIVEWQRHGGQLSPAQMQRAVENGIRASGLTQKVEQLTDQTDRNTEPHRSQIKAVIDHTVKHPIVHRQKKRDDYTLANAVREVWNANEAKWSHISGVYETFEQLKTACYNLQQKPDDPFTYKK